MYASAHASFETDQALPEFSGNWGYTTRSTPRHNPPPPTSTATFGASLASSAMASHSGHASASFGAIESPNGAAMFTDPSFLPEYDATLYSLWNSGTGMGYETEQGMGPNPPTPTPSAFYLTSEDELKMAYPQLPEFPQDLEAYLNESIESGGPSPTTPLGTTKAMHMVKMSQFMPPPDRRSSSGTSNGTLSAREAQLEKLLAPASASDYLLKRDEGPRSTKRAADHVGKRCPARETGSATYAATASSSGHSVAAASAPTSSLRLVSRHATAEVHSETGDAATVATRVVSCSSAARSKADKRPRSRQCEFPGCPNRARSHQKCKKHGGAHQCVFEGCTKNSQSRGLCIAHGGGSRCKKEGCARAAQSKGLCKSHGGGEYCAVEGCNKKAHLKHLCRTHGGGVRCKVAKCLKWAQRKGWCMAHAKEFTAS
ncbi:hypothetical protein PsorP6_009435 [Peronosclerospora sorghi]|uniref:Uncharacterized protein n=1 Tax=Peronosclerospora sorghi TaxID=230839 RepID=A0ACC0VXM1_9STRA|nr:hypothetical protein PsorP6_009435 [Peronosclerospora sorghi]